MYETAHSFLPHAHVSIFIGDGDESSFQTLVCTLEPADGLYQGTTWRFVIEIPISYPFKAPMVKALGPIFHPNIDMNTGSVALALLDKDWSPVLTLRMVILGLVLLFVEPNLQSVINRDCAHILCTDKEAFIKYLDANKKVTNKICLDPKYNQLHCARSKRSASEGPFDESSPKRRFVFPKSPQYDFHDEGGAQRILVQKLTHCSLAQSTKRRKLDTVFN